MPAGVVNLVAGFGETKRGAARGPPDVGRGRVHRIDEVGKCSSLAAAGT